MLPSCPGHCHRAIAPKRLQHCYLIQEARADFRASAEDDELGGAETNLGFEGAQIRTFSILEAWRYLRDDDIMPLEIRVSASKVSDLAACTAIDFACSGNILHRQKNDFVVVAKIC